MESNFKHLSKQATELIERKSELSAQDYCAQLESLAANISEIGNVLPKEVESEEVDLVEKMSFEIRTPMNSILGFTGLLKDSYFNRQEKGEFIHLIEKNSDQLIQLLNDLTDLTKVESHQVDLRIEKFELNVFILSFISDYQQIVKDKNIVIEKLTNKEIIDDICIISDPYQLRHILDNLMLNLVALSKNNKILLHVQIENNQFLIIKIRSNNSELPDNITQSIKKHISYSLRETNFDGTGLRLTLTKALVDLMQGEIHFNCIPNVGSEFIVKVPVSLCEMKA